MNEKPGFFRRIIEIALLASVYFATAQLGQVFAIPPGNVTPVWVPSGLIIAALLLRGYWLWPGIFLGAFFGNVCAYFDFENMSNIAESAFSGSMNGMGDALCALAAVWLIKRFTLRVKQPTQVRQLTYLTLFGSIMAGTISAVFGVSGLMLSDFIAANDYWSVFITWWVGDSAGVLLFTPLLLRWRAWQSWQWFKLLTLIELLFFTALLLLTIMFSLGLLPTGLDLRFPPAVVLPILLLSVFRYPYHITLAFVLLTATLLLLTTVEGLGTFANQDQNTALLQIQMFLFPLVLTILFLLANREDRLATSRALEESREYNRTLFEELPLGLALCDMSGRLIDVNQEYADILGRSIKDTLQLTYWQITPEKYAAKEDEQLQSLTETGRYGPYDKEYLHKDGLFVPVRLTGRLITINGQQYIWSSVEDITVEKETQRNLELARKQAIEANRAKTVFLSSISHELRTPLNAILGFTQYLESISENPDARQKKALGEIRNGGEHLLHLINELLDLTQIEAGKLIVNPQPTPLKPVIADCYNFIEHSATANNLELIFEQKIDYWVNTDALRLKQILLNFLSNAVKYNSERGRVELACTQKNNLLRISVYDTGPGIDQNTMASIVKPFERAGAEKSAIQGTGIGLALCKQLASLLNIEIGVNSEPGSGSEFWLDLELIGEPTEASPPKATTVEPAG